MDASEAVCATCHLQHADSHSRSGETVESKPHTEADSFVDLCGRHYPTMSVGLTSQMLMKLGQC